MTDDPHFKGMPEWKVWLINHGRPLVFAVTLLIVLIVLMIAGG